MIRITIVAIVCCFAAIVLFGAIGGQLSPIIVALFIVLMLAGALSAAGIEAHRRRSKDLHR